MKRSSQGFTLLEILVALTILALGLAAASRVSINATDSAGALRERLLATWVAENQAAWLHASRQWPAAGSSSGQSRIGERDFAWQQQTNSAAQDRFRRFELTVRAGEAPESDVLAHFIGYLEHP